MEYSAIKEENTDICNNMDKSQNYYGRTKKSDLKSCLIYGSIYMTYWKSKTVGTKINQYFQEVGMVGKINDKG